MLHRRTYTRRVVIIYSYDLYSYSFFLWQMLDKRSPILCSSAINLAFESASSLHSRISIRLKWCSSVHWHDRSFSSRNCWSCSFIGIPSRSEMSLIPRLILGLNTAIALLSSPCNVANIYSGSFVGRCDTVLLTLHHVSHSSSRHFPLVSKVLIRLRCSDSARASG